MNTTESIIRCVCARWQGETHDKVEKKTPHERNPRKIVEKKKHIFFHFILRTAREKMIRRDV
jgi:hypothetical protein